MFKLVYVLVLVSDIGAHGVESFPFSNAGYDACNRLAYQMLRDNPKAIDAYCSVQQEKR